MQNPAVRDATQEIPRSVKHGSPAAEASRVGLRGLVRILSMSRMLTMAWIVSMSASTALAGIDVQEGVFESNTYSIAFDSELANGDLILLLPPLLPPLSNDSFGDNRIVQAHLYLAQQGFMVASIEGANYPSLDFDGRIQELRRFVVDLQNRFELGGRVFLAGAPGTGTIVRLMQQQYPGEFAGAVAIGGIADIEQHLEWLRYALLERFWTFEDRADLLAELHSVQLALRGPEFNRHSNSANPRLSSKSPVSGVANLSDLQINVHGDSDLVHPQFHHWRYVDAITAADKGTNTIHFSVPAGGQFAPGNDVAGYWGDLILECIEWVTNGTPPEYVPGTSYGPRHVSAERVPTANDVRQVNATNTITGPLELSLSGRVGNGSHLGGWNDVLRLVNLDETEDLEIVFGDAEGYVHIYGMGRDGRVGEIWRSPDLGELTVALDVGPLGESGQVSIVVGNYAGELWRITGTEPYQVDLIWTDPRNEPILDVFIANLPMSDDPVILYRTFDGYVIAIDGVLQQRIARSPYLGPAFGLGMAVGDLEDDGTVEIAVGVADGRVLMLDPQSLGIRKSSGPLGFAPSAVWFANVFGQPVREVLATGTNDPTRPNKKPTTSLMNTELQEVKRTRQFTRYQGYDAVDRQGEGVDDLLLGCEGKLTIIDFPSKRVEQWNHPSANEGINAVATGDLDRDGKAEVITLGADGSIDVVDLATLMTRSHRPGIAGGYAMELINDDATTSRELVVPRRPDGLVVIDTATVEVTSEIATPEHWIHTLEITDVDRDGKQDWIAGTGAGIADDAASLEGFLLALRPGGLVDWSSIDESQPLDGVSGAMWGLAVENIRNSGHPEIIVGTNVMPDHGRAGSPLGHATIQIFDGTQRRRVETLELEAHDLFGLEAADIDDDGNLEIVVADRRGFVHIIEAPNGSGNLEVVYRSSDLGGAIVGMEIADLDAQAPPEILVGNDEGRIHVLRWNGSELEVIQTGPRLGTHLYGLTSGNILGDEKPEVLAGNAHGDFFILDANLSTLFVERGLGAFIGAYDAFEINDIDLDSVPEIVVGSSGYVYIFEIMNRFRAGGGFPGQGGSRPTGYDHAPPISND